MKPDLFARYEELQRYVGFDEEDVAQIVAAGRIVEPDLLALIDDFYAEIERHPDAAKAITGGQAQVQRLKQTLLAWLKELLAGKYDADYVSRRWNVGLRHVEIGLDQVFTNAALSRLRNGLFRSLTARMHADTSGLLAMIAALNKLLDLDLAIIEDAYQTEYLKRQQQVERLATIGQVAGGVAHELRNPLNVVRTSVYFLLNVPSAPPEKKQEHLRRIERQVTVADNVIGALSEFAKLPVPVFLPVPVEPCLREVLDSVTVPANVKVELDVPADLPPLAGDKRQLAIIFANLVRNACDAMPQGGQLRLAARAKDKAIEVQVADTGVGIPPESLPRILEPLYSTKARGIGLGLAISNAILAKHGVTLSVTSQVGAGSTFTLHFPLPPDAPSPGGSTLRTE